MFHCFVYFASTHCRLCRYCSLTAVCLLPMGMSIHSLHIIVHPVMSHFLHHLVLGEYCCSILCFLAADTWSLSLICSSVADPTCPELLLAFTGTFTVYYQLKLPLISTSLHPLTHNSKLTPLMEHP